MYDAKEKEKLKNDTYMTKGICISDRSYFNKIQSENMINLKSAYIPKENILDIK